MTTPRKPEPALESVRAILEPRSVAVVGASRRRDKVGGQVLHNLLSYGFNGPVFPVNPAAGVVQSVLAYPSVSALPQPVDLVVVAVPQPQVLPAAQDAIACGAKALVVLTAGFGEAGTGGMASQQQLLAMCRHAGVRLVGPNCLGLVNTNPAIRLNALFSPVEPPSGRIAFASQSGALGLAAMQFAADRGLGFSSFVSMGNKADVSSNDLLEFWEQDPHTDVILLYLESFGNPRRFSQIVQRVARVKPVVAVKSGRSNAGARAAASHTGAMLASSDITVDALFRQAGVVRVDTVRELFDVASCLAHQPLPRGRGVAIVTNVGGPGIMCADACEAQGLSVPELGAATQQALRALLPAEAGLRNPVDMIATATADQFGQTIGVVAGDPAVDAVVSVFIQPLNTQPEDVAQAIRTSAAGGKPLLAVFMAPGAPPNQLRAGGSHIPDYPFPEEAALALSRAVAYAEWRAVSPVSPQRPLGIDRLAAQAALAAAAPTEGGWLPAEAVSQLLTAYGLPVLPHHLAPDPMAAGAAAGALGGMVVLKAVAPQLIHKSDVGGVTLGLNGAPAVQAAAQAMDQTLRSAGHAPTGFLVQRQITGGVEMFAGMVHDPRFGPLIACGAGGVLVELLGDVAVGLAPLTPDDAWAMLRGLKSYRLLTGYRGSAPVQQAAVIDTLLRLSALAEDFDNLLELDCNPVIVTPDRAFVVDARVRCAVL